VLLGLPELPHCKAEFGSNLLSVIGIEKEANDDSPLNRREFPNGVFDGRAPLSGY